MVIPSLNFDLALLRAPIAAGVGGVLFLGGASAPADLGRQIAKAAHAAPGGIRPLTMADEEGGGVQRLSGLVEPLSWPRQMARVMTVVQVRSLASAVGREMRQAGVDMDLAPVLDVDSGSGPNRTDADGMRSFSGDAITVARYGTAFLDGLRHSGVISVVKHFPGLGGALGNTDYGAMSTQALSGLRSGGLLPFRAAIAAGVSAIMVSNANVPELTTGPASISPAAIDGLLRHDLGFGGLVLTDSLSAGAIEQTGLSIPQAAVAAITAGADMVLFGSTLTPAQSLLLSPAKVGSTAQQIINALVTAVRAGAIPIKRLDDAATHIAEVRNVNACAGPRG